MVSRSGTLSESPGINDRPSADSEPEADLHPETSPADGSNATGATQNGPDEPAPKRGAGRPTTPLVTRQAIIEAALEMIDLEGLGAFSVRKLARTFDVSQPTIYHHFRDREDLLGQVVRYLLQNLSLPEPQRNWQEYLMVTARQYRKLVMQHPNVAPLLAARPWHSGPGLVNEAVRKLDSGGVPPHLQLLMLRAVEIVVIGSGVLSGRLSSSMYGEVAEKYEFLRSAIAADDIDEAETFEMICGALVAGLTASVISNAW
jgi:TetR/AcrR family transcriptional regulator, tetracycline repressor protein